MVPKRRTTKRPAKLPNVVGEVRARVDGGLLRYSTHASERMDEREITEFEVESVLSSGSWVKRRDRYEEEHKSWSYCFEGDSIEERSLRIIVTFEDPDLLVVTTIER